MTMTNTQTPAQPVTTITGNPGLDSLIRSALIAAAAALTGVMLGWLNAHGFNDPNLNLLLSGAVLTVLTTAAVTLWGYLKGTQVGRAVADAHVAGVTAGANLALSGNAVTTTDPSTGATVVAPFTVASAKETIADYAATTPPKA